MKNFVVISFILSMSSAYAECTINMYGNTKEEIGLCAKEKYIKLSSNTKAKFESNLSWDSFTLGKITCIRSHENIESDLEKVQGEDFICQTEK